MDVRIVSPVCVVVVVIVEVKVLVVVSRIAEPVACRLWRGVPFT